MSVVLTEDVKTLWTYCWVEKAQQKNVIHITEPLANTQSHLLHYDTKEAQFGNLSWWDFKNTKTLIAHLTLTKVALSSHLLSIRRNA